MRPYSYASYFTVRRLTQADKSKALALYAAQGRDGVWVGAQPTQVLFEHAHFWGGFLGQTLALCGGICNADAPIHLLEEALKTRLLPPTCMVFLPCAVTPEGAPYLTHFLQVLLAQQMQETSARPEGGLAALLPVKSCSPMAGAYFACGLTLQGIRPLFQLRPHYVFLQTEVKPCQKYSIMIPLEDTLTLSRLLEDGYAGTGLRTGGVQLQQIF